MNSDAKRKLTEVVRGLLGSGFEGSQKEITEQLHHHGITVTQSTVSRTLAKIGAIRVRRKNRTAYCLQSSFEKSKLRPALRELVCRIDFNESMIVIHTNPGSAMFIAGFLDHYRPARILGTVAGDDTIFVTPRSTKSISLTVKAIKQFLRN